MLPTTDVPQALKNCGQTVNACIITSFNFFLLLCSRLDLFLPSNEGKGREGKGREGEGREGKGRETSTQLVPEKEKI
jgi:hypothetical protein